MTAMGCRNSFLLSLQKSVSEAYGDANMRKLKKGDVIQLERKGYWIVDRAADAGQPEQPMVLLDIPDGRAAKTATAAAPAAAEQPAQQPAKAGKADKKKKKPAAAAADTPTPAVGPATDTATSPAADTVTGPPAAAAPQAATADGGSDAPAAALPVRITRDATADGAASPTAPASPSSSAAPSAGAVAVNGGTPMADLAGSAAASPPSHPLSPMPSKALSGRLD